MNKPTQAGVITDACPKHGPGFRRSTAQASRLCGASVISAEDLMRICGDDIRSSRAFAAGEDQPDSSSNSTTRW